MTDGDLTEPDGALKIRIEYRFFAVYISPRDSYSHGSTSFWGEGGRIATRAGVTTPARIIQPILRDLTLYLRMRVNDMALAYNLSEQQTESDLSSRALPR